MRRVKAPKEKGKDLCQHAHHTPESTARMDAGLPVPPPRVGKHVMRWNMNRVRLEWEAVCERDDITFYCPVREES